MKPFTQASTGRPIALLSILLAAIAVVCAAFLCVLAPAGQAHADDIKNPCTITFETGVSGVTVDPIVVERGTKVSSYGSDADSQYLPHPTNLSKQRHFLYWSFSPNRLRANVVSQDASGYKFDRQDEVRDGTVINSNVTLYAAYYDGRGTIDGKGYADRHDSNFNMLWWYNANGGQGEMTGTFSENMITTVKNCEFNHPGYKFVRWNNFADGSGASYLPGQKYFTSSWSQPLYAIWEPLGASKQFTDLSSADWYLQVPGGAFPGTTDLYLDYTVGKGLMSGYTDGSGRFDPWGEMTRGMAITVIYRMATGATAETTDNVNVDAPFSDVHPGDWYAAAVDWAKKNDITTGYTDGSGRFGPTDPISREQLVTMIARYCESVGMEATSGDVSMFNDGGAIHDWALDGVAFCYAHGIVSGMGDTGNFAPDQVALRCQMAKIIAVADRMEKPAANNALAAQAHI